MSTYSQVVSAHFHEPKNVGALEQAHAEGFSGYRRSGPFMAFTARVRDQVIEEVRYRTYGCAPAIAAGSLLSEAIKGRSLAEAASWDVPRLLEALGGLPEDKHHCAELAIDALQDLVRQLFLRCEGSAENSLDPR